MIDCSTVAPGLVLPNATGMRRYRRASEWLATSRERIGASSIPKILGLSTYGGPWSEWSRRCLPTEVSPQTAVQRRGQRWERRVLEDYADETGHGFIGPLGHLVIDGPRPWLAVTPDAFLKTDQGWELGEAKTDRSPFPWGASGQFFERWTSDAALEIREDYAVQLYGQLWATGLEWGRLIVMRSMDDLRWYALRRDAAIEAWMDKRLTDFWSLVERYRAGDESATPEIDDTEWCDQALARLFDPSRKLLVPASDEDLALADELTRLQSADEAVANRITEIKRLLVRRISAAEAYGIDLGDGEKVLWQRGANNSRHIRLYRRG